MRHFCKGMRHLFLKVKDYFCSTNHINEIMIQGLYILTQEMEACLIVGVGAVLISILFGYVSLREYRMYLDENNGVRFSLLGFIKQEQFYFFLCLLFMILIAFIRVIDMVT